MLWIILLSCQNESEKSAIYPTLPSIDTTTEEEIDQEQDTAEEDTTNTNTATEEDLDQDNDGFEIFDDCDDNDPTVHPEANEVEYDGIDNDCDESTPDDDIDGDSYPLEDDCDDKDESIHPNALDNSCDQIDQNCNGQEDEDWDGDQLEPNDINPYDFGNISNQDLIIASGNLFPDNDEDNFLLYIEDGWFDFFGFSIEVASVPADVDIRLILTYHGEQRNSTSEIIANVNSGYLGEAERIETNGDWFGSDTGYYQLTIVGVSGSSCSSSYQITIDPDG